MPRPVKPAADHLDRQLLKHLARGLSLHEIASLERMTFFGVKHRIAGLRQIYHARNLPHLVFIAIQESLVTCPLSDLSQQTLRSSAIIQTPTPSAG